MCSSLESQKSETPLSQDRPDLIISELSGLAFDSLQQAFRPDDLDTMFNQEPPEPRNSEAIYIAIDPAAGGPSSDYALVSMTRYKGMITVSLATTVLESAQIRVSCTCRGPWCSPPFGQLCIFRCASRCGCRTLPCHGRTEKPCKDREVLVCRGMSTQMYRMFLSRCQHGAADQY